MASRGDPERVVCFSPGSESPTRRGPRNRQVRGGLCGRLGARQQTAGAGEAATESLRMRTAPGREAAASRWGAHPAPQLALVLCSAPPPLKSHWQGPARLSLHINRKKRKTELAKSTERVFHTHDSPST